MFSLLFSLQQEIRDNPPSPLLIFPGWKKEGSKLPEGIRPTLQPGTRTRAEGVGTEPSDPRMVRKQIKFTPTSHIYLTIGMVYLETMGILFGIGIAVNNIDQFKIKRYFPRSALYYGGHQFLTTF